MLYVDKIEVELENPDQHEKQAFSDRLRSHWIIINMAKCIFTVSKIKFLGQL